METIGNDRAFDVIFGHCDRGQQDGRNIDLAIVGRSIDEGSIRGLPPSPGHKPT